MIKVTLPAWASQSVQKPVWITEYSITNIFYKRTVGVSVQDIKLYPDCKGAKIRFYST